MWLWILLLVVHPYVSVFTQEQHSDKTRSVEQFVRLGLLLKHGDVFHVRGHAVYVDIYIAHSKVIKT